MSFKPPKEGAFLPPNDGWRPGEDDVSEFYVPEPEMQAWHPPKGLPRPPHARRGAETPEERELRRRRLESWPEPPDSERFFYKGVPFQLLTVVYTPHLPHAPFPAETTNLRTLTVASQADLEQAERECRGLPEFSIRQQLSMLCDQQPQSVGLTP